MRLALKCNRSKFLAVVLSLLLCLGVAGVALAQPGYAPPAPVPPPPPLLTAPQLDQLVQRIALYPDPLLAQTLTASTFHGIIPEAAVWADQHSYLKGDALAAAIQDDQLQWDPSVLGLLAFPSVLDMMARDPGWTQTLGNAVLMQRPEVMDAVQRERQIARGYGYLVPNAYENVVVTGGYISILPLNPALYYVPVYAPAVVFVAPRPGFAVGTAIHFGPGIVIGATFTSWGWFGGPGFVWGAHTILIGGAPWGRTWYNRAAYVHPYARGAFVRSPSPRVERHAFERRDR
jgi:hypothetical protein